MTPEKAILVLAVLAASAASITVEGLFAMHCAVNPAHDRNNAPCHTVCRCPGPPQPELRGPDNTWLPLCGPTPGSSRHECVLGSRCRCAFRPRAPPPECGNPGGECANARDCESGGGGAPVRRAGCGWSCVDWGPGAPGECAVLEAGLRSEMEGIGKAPLLCRDGVGRAAAENCVWIS